MNILFIALVYPVVKYVDMSIMIWLVLVCLWMNALVGSFGHILTPAINGDIRDYQQYVSGERIDGMFAAVGLIGNVISMITGSVLPFIYNKVGLNAATAASMGYTNVYDVLYNQGYFTEEYLSKFPDGLVFVNVTRGEIAPEGELMKAFESGKLDEVFGIRMQKVMTNKGWHYYYEGD